MVAHSFVLLHSCRSTCLQTYLLVGFFQIMTHYKAGATSVPSLNWLLFVSPDGVRGRVLCVAYFASWHTACGWAFRWGRGIGGIRDTQSKSNSSYSALFPYITTESVTRSSVLTSNLSYWVGEQEALVCGYSPFSMTFFTWHEYKVVN